MDANRSSETVLLVWHALCPPPRRSVCESEASEKDLLSMGWKLLVGFVVICVVGAGALAYYGSNVGPERRPIEQVIPDSQLPK